MCNKPIYNNTEEDFTIGKHSLLGDLQPVEGSQAKLEYSTCTGRLISVMWTTCGSPRTLHDCQSHISMSPFNSEMHG